MLALWFILLCSLKFSQCLIGDLQREEIDNATLSETGCKYYEGLVKGMTVMYTSSSTHLQHTLMGSLHAAAVTTNMTSPHWFEMRVALRSDKDMHILLFSRKYYQNTSQTQPDFDFELGVNNNGQSRVTLIYPNKPIKTLKHQPPFCSSWSLLDTPGILAKDKYVNFHITLNKRQLTLAKNNEPPMFSERNPDLYPTDIVLFGFKSKSESGARVLFDCPLE